MDVLVTHGIGTWLHGRNTTISHKKCVKVLHESNYLSFYLTNLGHLMDTLSKYIPQGNFYMYVTSFSEVNMRMLLDWV